MKDVGGIQYTVVADTEQLLKAEQDTNKSVDKMDKKLQGLGKSSKNVDKVTDSVKDLGKEADKGSKSLSALQKSMLGALTVGTALTIGKMADDYRTLSERVGFATNSVEEYEQVQKRLIQTANETYRSLEEASEVFIGTSDNLRSLGYSLEESLDIADSLSFAFVKNATATDAARNALRQYDVALNKGKVDMMGWQVINNAVPTLAQDIAKSLGVTTQEVLNMGIASEITAQMLNDALLQSFESNREAATGMATSIEDAFVNLRTNLSVFLGEANKTVGATDLVASAIGFLSENISTLAILMGSAGAGAAAKYVASMGAVTVAKAKGLLATRASIIEEMRLAQANLEAARSEVARTSAMVAKGVGHAKNAKAIELERLAVVRLDQAQKASLITTRSFMALLGGPAGIIGILAAGATAFYAFSQSAEETNTEITNLKKPIADLTKEIEDMTKAQREAALVTYEKEQKQAIKEVDDAYQALFDTMREGVPRAKTLLGTGNQSVEALNALSKAIFSAKENGDDLLPVIEKLAREWGIPKEDLDAWITLNGNLSTAIQTANTATTTFNELKNVISGMAQAALEAGKAAREQAGIIEKLSSVNKTLQEQMGRITDKGSALNKYMREHGNEIDKQIESGIELNETIITQHNENIKLATAIDAESKARKTSNKEINQSAQVLKDLQNELQLATLSGKELAIARAEQRLNEFATEQEVIAVRNLAAALYDLNQVKKFGETEEEQDKYFTGGDILKGGAFDDQEARYQAELEAEMARYAKLQEEFVLFRDQKLRTEEEYNDLEYAMKQKHEARMQQIEQAKNSIRLKSYADSANAIAMILSNSNKEQSGFYKAAFAVAKGFAVADATVNAWNAISKAWASAPFPANLGAVAATTPAVMGVVSSIQGTSYGGARQYGGAVNAESYYRVNEGGAPEIFQDSRGHQYMMPNTRGQVISNKDATAMQQASNNVTINLIENAQRGGEYEQDFDGSSQIITLFVADIRDGGEMSQALEANYNLSRRGE